MLRSSSWVTPPQVSASERVPPAEVPSRTTPHPMAPRLRSRSMPASSAPARPSQARVKATESPTTSVRVGWAGGPGAAGGGRSGPVGRRRAPDPDGPGTARSVRVGPSQVRHSQAAPGSDQCSPSSGRGSPTSGTSVRASPSTQVTSSGWMTTASSWASSAGARTSSWNQRCRARASSSGPHGSAHRATTAPVALSRVIRASSRARTSAVQPGSPGPTVRPSRSWSEDSHAPVTSRTTSGWPSRPSRSASSTGWAQSS